ncbi:1-aminocyclopropane-1-carboxylate deaminase/D-cysteine desulfhydrase [Neolewinella litorea]|uniref:Pyridoxal-phosphate dependent enzyme n=1 Tax=Neolewinella litorea TaxID=2562452 RepID=A0A4S4NKY3_9BACT|nr:pyridoxal-phosphate dependent enzyme [Neolewinella litorea]THH40499.1 pyridoxal-phosphate dependent enzyme [Neolewinella litorea]
MIPPLPASPLERLHHPAAEAAGVQLFVKRDDHYSWEPLDPLQGNKVRKLAPLLARDDLRGRMVVSFGGAYSNHVAALSSAGRRFGFRTRFYIRGEAVRNPTLDLVTRNGSTLHFLDRTAYRRKHDPDFQRVIGLRTEEIVVPEGGSQRESLPYAGAVYAETVDQLGTAPDYFCLSAGTGGTAAGVLLAAYGSPTRVEVFPALRGDWMAKEIRNWLTAPEALTGLDLITDFSFGGYARFPAAWRLYTPAGSVATRAEIKEPLLPPLEPVYTAKLFAGVLHRISAGYYPRGGTVVILHSGGIY